MLDIDASLKDTKFWQNINFYLVLIACNGKWKSSLKYVYKYENVLSIVWNVTLVTHITEYRKSTSVPRSPAPNEVRILTSINLIIHIHNCIKGWSLKFPNFTGYSGLYLWKEQKFQKVEEVWPPLKIKWVILLQLFWIPVFFRDIGRCLPWNWEILRTTLYFDHHHFDEKLKLFFSYSNLTKYLFIITDYHILQITWQFLLKGWYFFILKVFTFLSHHTEPKIFIFAYYFLTNIFIRHFEITLLFSRYKLSKV